jgi:hypothetical protein
MGEQQPAGLMRLRTAPAITPTRELIDQVLLPALGSTTLKPTTFYKHAVVSIYGDGDPQVTQTVTIGAFTTIISGSQPRVFTISNENLTIQAANTDAGNARRTSTIEVLSLEWG